MSAEPILKSDRRASAVAVLAIIVASALTIRYAVKFWSERIPENAAPPFLGGTFGDLRDATWLPVRAVLSGVNPYDTVTYLQLHPYSQDFPSYTPAHLALWLPMGWLDWAGAIVVYLVVSIGVVTAVGAWGGVRALRAWRPGPLPVGAVTAAAATGVAVLWLARTVTAAVGPGQPSVVYALAAAPAVLGTRHRWSNALLIALTCLKPQLGIIVVLVVLAQRRWADAAWGVGIAGAVSLATGVAVAGGPAGLPAFLGQFLGNVQSAGTVRVGELTLEERIDVEAALRGVGVVPGGLVLAVIAVAGLALCVLAVRWALRRQQPAVAGLLGLGIGLLPIYHISYDAMWLLIPVAVGAGELHRRAGGSWLYPCLPGLVLVAASSVLARWHQLDVVFGTGTGVNVQRLFLVAGLLATAVGLALASRKGRPDQLHQPNETARQVLHGH